MTILAFTPARSAGIALAVLALSLSSRANATTYDTSLAPPGVYYGNGNSGENHGWTVNDENSIELGLGVVNRTVGAVDPTSTNVYNVNTGYSSPSGACAANTCAIWDFEFSVNLNGSSYNLGQIENGASITILNEGNGQSITINPAAFGDDAGWTGSSFNQEADVGFANDIGAQNAENLAFSFVSLTNSDFDFNPLANDSYLITATLKDSDGNTLDTVSEVIDATPLPAALPLFAGGLGLLGFFARKRKRKAAFA